MLFLLNLLKCVEKSRLTLLLLCWVWFISWPFYVFFFFFFFFNLTIFLKRKSDCIRLYFDGTFRFQRNLCALWRSLSMLILFISSFFLLWWWWFLLIYFCLFIYFLIAKLYENVLWKQSIYVVLYCLTNFILFGMYIQTSAISEFEITTNLSN